MRAVALALALGFFLLYLILHLVLGIWFHEPLYDIFSGVGEFIGEIVEGADTGNDIIKGLWNFFTLDWDGDSEHGEFWKFWEWLSTGVR